MSDFIENIYLYVFIYKMSAPFHQITVLAIGATFNISLSLEKTVKKLIKPEDNFLNFHF